MQIDVIVDQRVNRIARKLWRCECPASVRAIRSACVTCGVVISTRYRSLGPHFGKFAQGIRRAIGDQLAVINVSDVAATFRFIHVMRRDEKRDAMAGEFEKQIPKLSARDGIDASGRFVEEEQLWLVQHGAAKRHPLLPSARKFPREAIKIRPESVQLNDLLIRRFSRSAGKP